MGKEKLSNPVASEGAVTFEGIFPNIGGISDLYSFFFHLEREKKPLSKEKNNIFCFKLSVLIYSQYQNLAILEWATHSGHC